MRHIFNELVPSMFQRRLFLLLLASMGIIGVLSLQLGHLTVAHGAANRLSAESVMREGYPIPTVRGRILDRRQRVLAIDEPVSDIAVKYDVINGQWAYERARHDAFVANRSNWPAMGYDEREKHIEDCQGPYDKQVDQLWDALCKIGHIDLAELEERKKTVSARVQKVAGSVWIREQSHRTTDVDDATPLKGQAQKVREQQMSYPLLSAADDAALLHVQDLINNSSSNPAYLVWSQVTIQPSRHRAYPLETLDIQANRQGLPSPIRADDPVPMHLEGVGIHVLGLMRNVWSSDLTPAPGIPATGNPGITDSPDTDLGSYLPGDKVGAWGIEKSEESRLRGERGKVVEYLDRDAEDRIEPVPGHDVTLTLDIALQARIQALMDPAFGLLKVQPWHSKDPTATSDDQPILGQPLNGAAVVMDVPSGQVLACVSTPALSLRRLRDEPDVVLGDKIDEPYINRVVARSFEPGSTVKPLVLAAAMTDHKVGYNETVNCQGYLDPGHPNQFRCWIFKSFNSWHGELTGRQAIEHSCNIFFYTMGRRLGAQRLVTWYGRYGLGRPTGSELEEEVGGNLPDLQTYRGPETKGFTPQEAILMGIGQGPIAWTPLQAANAYATLARGGLLLSPTFVLDSPDKKQTSTQLDLDPRAIEEAMAGLDLATNEKAGTANHLAHLVPTEPIFNCPGVRIIGKSGTATSAPLKVDGKVVRQGDHAWYIGLVTKNGESKPRYVIAVIVEFGGSGGNVAGPVANQILYVLKDEGYL